MKAVSLAFRERLKQGVQARAKLFRLVLKDGTTFYFTNSVVDLDYNGHIWESLPGVSISAVRGSIDAAQLTATVTVPFTPDGVTLPVCRYGGLDSAEFNVIMIHTDEPSAGSMYIFGGYVDDIDFSELVASVNLIGYETRNGAAIIGEAYSERCRNVFGDVRCKYPVDTMAVGGYIADYGSNAQTFIAQPIPVALPGDYLYGTIKFTTGKNKGRVYDLGRVEAGEVAITNKIAFPLAIGDYFELRPGCSKFRAECVTRWQNLVNFRAEPDVPNIVGDGLATDVPKANSPTTENTYIEPSYGVSDHFIVGGPGGFTATGPGVIK